MLEFLLVWGVSNLVGFAYKPILEKLASLAVEVLEDYVKEFFGVCIKDKIDLAKEVSFKNAFGKAVIEFLSLVQQELEDHDIDVEEIAEYQDDLDKFISNKNVLRQLGIPFQKALGNHQPNEETIDIGNLVNRSLNVMREKSMSLSENRQNYILY